MGNFSEQQATQKENREKYRVRKEKLAGFFYNLAQLSFAALVLGGLTPLLNDSYSIKNLFVLLFGAMATYIFASTANRILKY